VLNILFQLGETFGLVQAGSDKKSFLAALHHSLTYAACAGIYWEMHPILFKFLTLLPSAGLAWFFNFVHVLVSSRFKMWEQNHATPTNGQDFLTQLFELFARKDDFTMDDVIASCLSNIGAGSDTTSVSLTSILYHLIKSPEKLDIVSLLLFYCYNLGFTCLMLKGKKGTYCDT